MTNLPDELFKLKRFLVEEAISSSEALDQIVSITSGFRSWQTSWWQKKRDEFIANECIQCGASSSETTMVLQHLWHPPSLQDLRGDAYKRYKSEKPFSAEVGEKINTKVSEEEVPLINCCPDCQSINLRFRKADAMWVCGRCKHTFATPATTPDKRVPKNAKKNLWQQEGKERYQLFLADENLQRQILCELIDGSLRYLSFHDTVTFCKRCAFRWDMEQKKICPACHKNYINFDSDICYSCQYDETTGLFKLYLSKARQWTQIEVLIEEPCSSVRSDYGDMMGYACILKQKGLEVLEIYPAYLRVYATQAQVYEALSGRKSQF